MPELVPLGQALLRREPEQVLERQEVPEQARVLVPLPVLEPPRVLARQLRWIQTLRL